MFMAFSAISRKKLLLLFCLTSCKFSTSIVCCVETLISRGQGPTASPLVASHAEVAPVYHRSKFLERGDKHSSIGAKRHPHRLFNSPEAPETRRYLIEADTAEAADPSGLGDVLLRYLSYKCVRAAQNGETSGGARVANQSIPFSSMLSVMTIAFHGIGISRRYENMYPCTSTTACIPWSNTASSIVLIMSE